MSTSDDKWRSIQINKHQFPDCFEVSFDAVGPMEGRGSKVPKGARVVIRFEHIEFHEPEYQVNDLTRDDYVAKAIELASNPSGGWVTFGRLANGNLLVCFGLPKLAKQLGDPPQPMRGAHVTLNPANEVVDYWDATPGEPLRAEYVARAIELSKSAG